MSRTAPTLRLLAVSSCVALAATAGPAAAGPHAPPNGGPDEVAAEKDYPDFDTVIEGLDKVVSTMDGAASLYDLYSDKETGKLLAVLPDD